MKTKKCPYCNTEIEIKNYYEKDNILNDEFEKPCDECKYNQKDEDKYPCAFCSARDYV